MCWGAIVEEGLRELRTSARGGNTKAKYLITLAYYHQGGDAKRTVIGIMAELRRQLMAKQMEAMCFAITDWAVARWGKTEVHQYKLKERIECLREDT